MTFRVLSAIPLCPWLMLSNRQAVGPTVGRRRNGLRFRGACDRELAAASTLLSMNLLVFEGSTPTAQPVREPLPRFCWCNDECRPEAEEVDRLAKVHKMHARSNSRAGTSGCSTSNSHWEYRYCLSRRVHVQRRRQPKVRGGSMRDSRLGWILACVVRRGCRQERRDGR